MPDITTPKPASRPRKKKPEPGEGASAATETATPTENAGPIEAPSVPKGPKAKGRRPEPKLKPGPAEEGELQLPTRPVEVPPDATEEETTARAAKTNGRPPLTVNIAKLQAMTMTELNSMAKEMGIENFGTMRKHEVIFHILQKNAERSGVLFSEGVLEVLPEGFGFLRSQSFNYLP